MRDFLADHPVDLDLICTRPLILDDLSGTTTDSHALRRKFHPGNRLVNLAHTPSVIHLSAATGFYRRDRICASDLRFDPAIRPNFEDASFTARYLSAAQEPLLGVIADAEYLYRRRFDGSSLVQQSWSQEAKYTTVLEHGYLDLLRRCAESTGSVPLWAQNTVLYDLLFYFRREENPRALPTSLPTVWTDRFHQLVAQILSYIPAETIARFSVIPTNRRLKIALIAGYLEDGHRPDRIWLTGFDARQNLVQARYFFGGPPPQEQVLLDGRPVAAGYGKTRDLVYLNRVLLHERVLWLPADGELTITLDGHPVSLRLGRPSKPALSVTPPVLRRHFSVPDRPRASSPREVVHAVRDRLARRKRSNVSAASPYRRAWVFVDDQGGPGGNIEHLYGYVKRRRPTVNAWFVFTTNHPTGTG